MKPRPKQTAFTMLELLVALSMIGLILAAVYGSHQAVTTSIRCCGPRSVLEQQARLVLDRITSELRCCYGGGPRETFNGPIEPGAQDEELWQDEIQWFIGQDIVPGHACLQFVTLGSRAEQSPDIQELTRVGYRVDESGSTLLRSERRYLHRCQSDENDDRWLVACASVKTMDLEYFDGKKWQPEWDSRAMNGLPRAVRVGLVLESGDTGVLSFVSTAHITCQGHQRFAVAVQETTAPRRDVR